ncbi:MAG TPA: c-type cytochrome [Gemmatimonadaceae bacterium]
MSDSRVPRLVILALAFSVSACSWFTDFKQQPKIDPWETASDTVPFRGNPQASVPMGGSAAPGFEYDRAPTPQNAVAMAAIKNPVAADSASLSRGRINYQINCAVCHGSLGKGDGVVMKYGFYPPAIGTAQSPAAGYPDGEIFGIIRNGKGLMPTYNRIEEMDRWDIINYLRSLQGKLGTPADTSHCRPGETGGDICVPGATQMGPTRPSPYYGHPSESSGPGVPSAGPGSPTGPASAAAEGSPMAAAVNTPAAPSDASKKAPTTRPDTTKKPEHLL